MWALPQLQVWCGCNGRPRIAIPGIRALSSRLAFRCTIQSQGIGEERHRNGGSFGGEEAHEHMLRDGIAVRRQECGGRLDSRARSRVPGPQRSRVSDPKPIGEVVPGAPACRWL